MPGKNGVVYCILKTQLHRLDRYTIILTIHLIHPGDFY